VELGEIESHLKNHLPGIAHVVVDQITLSRRDNIKVLTAFLKDPTSREESSNQPKKKFQASNKGFRRISAELKAELMALATRLGSVLAPSMIPAMFVCLSSIPLSISGKTDRRRLQDLANDLTDDEIAHFSLADTEKRGPTTDMEKKMQRLWAQVLGLAVEAIGLDDHFIRLGGDSLTAMRLAVLTRESGISIMVNQIFKHPTLFEMASIAVDLGDENCNELQPFALLRDMVLSEDEPSTKTEKTEHSSSGPLKASTRRNELSRQANLNVIFDTLETEFNIEKDSVQDMYPTSPLQEGLFALSIREPGSYIFQWATTLHPMVDVGRFMEAWQTCIQRSDILRTRIIYSEGFGMLQVVVKGATVWTTSGSLSKYLSEDRLHPMGYGRPLSRWAILNDDTGRTNFVWTAHHSLYDGFSVPMMLAEVGRIYNANGSLRLPPPAPYRRFIEYLERRDKRSEENYWKSQFPEGVVLSNFPPIQSSAFQSLTNSTETRTIRLPKFTSSGFTTSTLIRAAWAIVLARYAESTDALFGALLAGRNASIKNIETMNGPTITTVPVHIQVNADQSVNHFLEMVQNQAVDMIPFEHTGLQRIKRISHEAKSACDFQNLLVIQPEPDTAGQSQLWSQNDLVVAGNFKEFLTFPLVFEVQLRREELYLMINYDSRLLSSERMGRMLHHFEHVFGQLEPKDEKLGNIQLTSPKDWEDVQTWNQTVSMPYEACVHDIISEQARQDPNASAICSWDDEFTYADLDELSSRVAGYLYRLGVRPEQESYVLLCFDKSAWAIVAMLGVLKAGAAYVSVDPTYPRDRKAYIAQDTSARIALTSPQHRSMFETLVDHIVGIDRAVVEKFLPSTTSTRVPPSNPAFIVFTSGSTGTPKGIVMEHRAFVTGARAHAPALSIDRHARVFQFAAYTYDVSMGEIFTTLMNGGCVCVPSEDERLSNLAGAIVSTTANWLFLTPTVAGLLHPSQVPTLKYLVLGGEHATKENISIWTNANKVRLINSYGPAECAIWTNCAPALKWDADPSNIGRRIGARLWVVERDNHERLTPIGCVGELVVEGPNLARGYLNDETKTAAAFIENPRWTMLGGMIELHRMYKTGDLCRYNFDGTISIVGRKGTQVKLNGQRLELGEVEHHLWADAEVNKAMVTFPDTGPCAKHLVAIVSLKHRPKNTPIPGFTLLGGEKKIEAGKQISRMRNYLTSKLPRYMVPTIWIILEDLPLNMSGKLDRPSVMNWVKEMGDSTYCNIIELGDSAEAKSLPSTNMERTVRLLWAKVLRIDAHSIGLDDSFLQIGGDSISALRLTAAARQDGISILVRTIFQQPTLKAMSAAATWEVRNNLVIHEPFSILKSTNTSLDTIALDASQAINNIEDVIEATDYQSWVLSHGHLKSRGYMNYFGIKFKGLLDVDNLRRACRLVVMQHPILRTVFIVQNQQLLQVILRHCDPEFVELDNTNGNHEGIPQSLINRHMKRNVELGVGIVRFTLLKQENNRHTLVLHISHAQYDGISISSILQDIRSAYAHENLSCNPAFSSYIHIIRDQNESEAQKFWKTTLAGSNMTNILQHHARPYKNPVNRILSRIISVPSLSPLGITFASTIKAAWALALSQLSAQSDIVFGQITSGRNAPVAGIQNIVGPCLNVIPVRVAAQPSWTNLDLLRHVQDQHLASLTHETLGMHRIIHECTDWPKWMRFSSILQHTNIGNIFGEDVPHGSEESEFTAYSPPHDVADVWIWSAPVGKNRFSIDFTFSDGIVPDNVAERMLDMLYQNIEEISNNVKANIDLEPGGKTTATIPIGYNEAEATSKYFKEHLILPSPTSSISNPEEIVRNAWAETFGTSHDQTQEVPFFELRGDTMAAVQLAHIFQRETGVQYAVEVILELPRMIDQIGLLSGKGRFQGGKS
jgi:amino acid adenylation domain-containing protein